MTLSRTSRLLAAAALAGLAACARDGTSPSAAVDDAQVTLDLAATAGDAIASDVTVLLGDETAAALPAPPVASDLSGVQGDSLNVVRTRTCYDAAHAVVADCDPSLTRSIAFHVQVDGSRARFGFTSVVHRLRDWVVTRNFDGATEVSRTHDGAGSSADTSTFTGALVTRLHAVAALDSTLAVVHDLPRAVNPWPVSGTIVKRLAVHTTVTKGGATTTRDFAKRVTVTFPADAEGNVVMTIDALTCTLNLVTHAVTACR